MLAQRAARRQDPTGRSNRNTVGVPKVLLSWTLLVGLLGAAAASLSPGRADADGVVNTFTSEVGCWAADWYSVGLLGDGAGTIALRPAPGPVAVATLTWTGRDDLTPDLATVRGRADSELTINGVVVQGTQPPGDPGWAPRGGEDWYTWSVSLGPDGVDLLSETTTQLDISGWDTLGNIENNGALLTVIYDTSPCAQATVIDEYQGVDYFYHGADPATGTVFIPVFSSSEETTIRLPFGLAGSDVNSPVCRGVALWFTAGQGATPPYEAFDLVDTTSGIGVGVNATGIYDAFDGVEIVNDPFQNAVPDCSPVLNPVPDAPYQPGHLYPGGALDSPFEAVSISPPSFQPDISLSIIEVSIPPNTDWIGFQLESEPDQRGESGAWIATEAILRPVPGALGDTAWFDKNGNCLQDPGEVGVSGVQVDLFRQDAAGNRAPYLDLRPTPEPNPATTNALGRYLFTGLPAGTFELDFTIPPEWSFTEANCGADDVIDSDAVAAPGSLVGNTGPILMPGDIGDLTWDVGLLRPSDVELAKLVALDPTGPFSDSVTAEVGDTAWFRVDISVAVEDANGLPYADALGLVVADVLPPGLTLVGGSPNFGTYDIATNTWTIGDLVTGSEISLLLQVEITQPGSFRNVAEVTAQDNEDTDSTPNNGEVDPPEDDFDDAWILVDTASIGDYVWLDANNDGCQGAQEVGISGVTVILLKDGVPVETQLTNADGGYLFDGLTPGNYTVSFGSVPGLGRAPIEACATGGDADDSNPVDSAVTIVGDEAILTIDHGLVPLSSIGDRVFLDANGDGCQGNDPNELNLAGVTVYLLQDGLVLATTTTDVDGLYLFTGLPPGTYTVEVDQAQLLGAGNPNGADLPATLSPVDACGDDTIDSDGVTVVVDLPPGTNDTSIDFGVVPPPPPPLGPTTTGPPSPPGPIAFTGGSDYGIYIGGLLTLLGAMLLAYRKLLPLEFAANER